ncbi:LemA family protein [Hyphococcus luteus]|uniref:LemA family protein n=1 Tax=Hyphococcus luteus TaxID=2058213 RepID=A0A2S7K995_9PROT|nr:LemA family protein [Marinicaulis flavus]PQA89077.1 hypothetical protein CW354_03765 [Marinicaulis flavus]
MTLWLVLLVLAAIAAVALAALYNHLVQKRQMTHNGWADIDVQLKRRADLIPQLVAAVQGYAAHERSLFEEVVEKRNAAMAVGDDPAARGAAESALSRPVAKMIAVAENYPELKASGNFLELQTALAETEDKIEMARRFYNGAVRELNTLIQSFPVNMLAGGFGFKKRDYFEIETAEKAAPSIDMGADAS